MIVRNDNTRKDECFNVAVSLQNKPTKGDVGIEIELESQTGSTFPKDKEELPKVWSYHKDGSLRGYDNAEYVLDKPIGFDETDAAIDDLWAVLAKKKVKLAGSNRTSVHVHLNVQDFYLNRLTTFAAMYFCVEEILTQWCGEHRVGNLFCLRAKDAPAIITQLRRFIRSDMGTQIRDNFHYAGFNANALHKFGSIEIRTLRGAMDPAVIKQWVAMLRRLHGMSADFNDPRTFVDMFSSLGPTEFYETLLGQYADEVQATIGWSTDQVRESMYEGIRLAQDLCYCRDWSKFEAIELRPDPFGRDARKLHNKRRKATASVTAQPIGFLHDDEAPDGEFGFEGEPIFDEGPAVQAAPVGGFNTLAQAVAASHQSAWAQFLQG